MEIFILNMWNMRALLGQLQDSRGLHFSLPNSNGKFFIIPNGEVKEG